MIIRHAASKASASVGYSLHESGRRSLGWAICLTNRDWKGDEDRWEDERTEEDKKAAGEGRATAVAEEVKLKLIHTARP